MEVYDALIILRRHCYNQPKCCKCILHKPDEPDSCAIAERGYTPSRWKLDREVEQPLIVKVFLNRKKRKNNEQSTFKWKNRE